MRKSLFVLGAAFAFALGLTACGGDDGAAGPPGPQGTAGTPGATGPAGPPGSAAIVLTPTTPAADFGALDLSGSSVMSVSIASPPVVRFKLATSQGVPIIGYGSKGKCYPRNNTTTPYTKECYPNLAFTIAKLVPGSGGTPSKWVNYLVTTVPTTGAYTDCATANAACLSRPLTDNTGTLVDNKDGTYTYTFDRDVPGMKAIVAGITPPAGSNAADLGDLTYDANATHRLVMTLSGSAPGTGSNNPTGLSSGYPASVSLSKPINAIYDFVPATGQAPAASANRKMVANSNCESCHSTLGGLPGGAGSSLDFHGGSRNNIDNCLVCHTEQRKFGRTEATYNATTRAFTGSTFVVDGRAIGNVMNFVHKIHVAGVMTRTGYDYEGAKFDQGGYSQDIRNCDKCHDSSSAATPQASLWKTEANRTGCGSCHDGINFDTGEGLTLADKAAGKTVSTDFFGKAHPDKSTDGTCLNSSCHNPGAGGDPDLVHKPVTPPNLKSALHVAGGSANTNSAWIASNTARLPAGAIKVSYDIKSVSAFLDTSVTPNVKRPRMVFRALQNGVRKDLNVLGAKPDNLISGQQELWDDFTGGPSLYFVWAVPQDGIAQPVDFNASVSSYLRCLWNGSAPLPDPDQCTSAGTLTGPDADGYYTATLTEAIIPSDAVMLTGGLGYSYNVTTSLPWTQTNLTASYPAEKSTVAGLNAKQPNVKGGLVVVAPNAQKVAEAGCADASPTPTGVCLDSNNRAAASGKFAGRRAIVEDKRCNACHQELGTFTEDAFHGGQRNDGTTCSWCHTPNRGSSAWTAETANMTHSIHAADKRRQPYTWHAISTTDYFGKIKYPGVLARCEQCHVAGSYDFSATASANAVGLGTTDQIDKRQNRTVGTGYYIGTAGGTTRTISGATCTTYGTSSAQTATGVFSLAPALWTGMSYNGAGNATTPNSGAFYGYGFQFNAGITAGTICPLDGSAPVPVPAGTAVQASPLSLVMSPTVTACVGCHDSDLAVSHMKVNGGAFYEARSTALPKVEQCFICHGPGKVAGIKEAHAK